MELSPKELIAKLENISALYKKTVAIQSKMDEFEPEDSYKREVKVPAFPGKFQSEKEREIWKEKLDHCYEDAVEIAEQVHRKNYGPQEPEKPVRKDYQRKVDSVLENKLSKLKIIGGIGIGVAIFFALGALVGVDESTADTLPVILGIAALGAAAFAGSKYMQNKLNKQIEEKNNEAMLAHERQQDAIMAEYSKKMKVYEGECAEYEVTLKSFLDDYRAWREIYLKSVEEEDQIAEKLEADRTAAVEKMYEEEYLPAEAALNECNDLVSEDYLPDLKVIIDLLKSKRADSLKEAINLYEDILYKERQLQLQQEQEEQRRYEEELRRQDEERRYQEDKRFREDQERHRQEEEAQRRKDEERWHKEEMSQREKQAQDEKRRQDEARRSTKRCVWCAHKHTCRQQYYDGAYNCTGFTPKS